MAKHKVVRNPSQRILLDQIKNILQYSDLLDVCNGLSP